METLKTFKIAENQKNYDVVELLYDNSNDTYIVMWKWTNMRQAVVNKYKLYGDAIEKYKERKHFAIMCN